MTAVVGAVLAGGAGRRMGRPKATVPVAGTTLVERVGAALVAGGAGALLLVGGRPEPLPPIDGVGWRWVPDRWPGEGPLGGLASALLAAEALDRDAVVVVAACDQPALSGAGLERLIGALAAPTAHAAAARTPDGRRHPFPSAWSPGSGVGIERAFAAGARRADAGFATAATVDVDFAPDDLVDLDTPADVAAWSAQVGRADDFPEIGRSAT